MLCTREEIEKKRREALEKLQKKKISTNIGANFNGASTSSLSSVINQNSANAVSNKSKFKFHSPKAQEKPYQRPGQAVAAQQFFTKEKTVTIKCSLCSECRFIADCDSFSSQAIDVFKTIPSRNYDAKSKKWDFHVKDYDLFLTKFEPLKPYILVERFPNFVVNCIKQPQADYSRVNLDKIEEKLRESLMPFQREGVCFGIEKNGRCLIADDMGLGKTFQALGIASYYRENWPLLIVTTSSMKNVWEETIVQYLPSVPLMRLQYMISAKDYIGEAHILIVSHDMMTRCEKQLKEKKFGVIIIDECHTFKNFKAKCTKAATELVKLAKNVILLSGTPALSRPSELYAQLALIDGKFFGSFFEYSKRYCDARKTNFGWDASGQSNLQELEIVLAKKFMIRRTKENALEALPGKKQQIVTLDVNLNTFSQQDRELLNNLSLKYNNEKSSAQKHALLLSFFSETSKLKIPSVMSYILQVLDEKKKFLVFAHHQIMLNAIEKILQKKNKKFIRIDGSTSSDLRKFFVDKFQLQNDCVCAILSITAANAGITLTAADLVIFAELHWNPSILSQAESRAHRIGQKNEVTIRYLLAPGTADDSIWPMLQKKQKILNEAGLCKETFNTASVSKQAISPTKKITEGIKNITNLSTMDISSYFSPAKKAKMDSAENKSENSNGDIFDDGLDELLAKQCDELNDGLDDIFASIDF